MLVLSRKLGEKILIEGGITITIIDIDRGKVRLGIEAPSDKRVYRSELVHAVLPGGEIRLKPTDLSEPKKGTVE